MTDYDVNNTYQYIVAREETHVSWLQHALLDLGAQIPAEPPRPAVAAGKGDAWKGLAAEDARANQEFVDEVALQGGWRHARSATKGHAEGAARRDARTQAVLRPGGGRHAPISSGTALAINQHSGSVIGTRWVE